MLFSGSSLSLIPGWSVNDAFASVTLTGCSNCAVMDTECERYTGTRTHVQVTLSSGSWSILRLSKSIFCSSLVNPLSRKVST